MSIQRTETRYRHTCPSTFPKVYGQAITAAITGVAHLRSKITWSVDLAGQTVTNLAYCPFCGEELPSSEGKADEEARK